MKIQRNYIIYLLCLFPFLQMPRLSYFSDINMMFFVAKALVGMYIFTKIIKSVLLKRKLSNVSIAFVLYEIILIFSTVVNKGEVFSSISNAMSILVPIFLVEYYIDKLTIQQLLKPINYIFFVYTIITMIQLLPIPKNIFHSDIAGSPYCFDEYGYIFALGEPKRFIFFILPMIASTILLGIKKKNNIKIKIKVWIVISISFITVFWSWGVSAMLAVFTYSLVYLFINGRIINKIFKIVNIRVIYIIIIIMNILLLGGGILNSLYLGKILSIFGKSSNLSGRTFIWTKIMTYIPQSPIIGFGVNSTVIKSRIWGFTHVHNLVLNLIYTGGFLLLAIFVFINFESGKKLFKYRNFYQSKIITMTIFIGLILSLTDTLDYNLFYIFYIIAFYIGEVKWEGEKENENSCNHAY